MSESGVLCLFPTRVRRSRGDQENFFSFGEAGLAGASAARFSAQRACTRVLGRQPALSRSVEGTFRKRPLSGQISFKQT